MDSRTRRATRTSVARVHLRPDRGPIKPKCLQGYQAHCDAGKFAVWDVGRELLPSNDPSPLIRNPHGPTPRQGVEPEYLGVFTCLAHPVERVLAQC